MPKWYPAEDCKKHFKRASKQPKQTRLRKNITPGTVVIVLSGRYRGKRVVFLKQLQQSGLLLVTGPYKVNGVPLKRLNQAYCIPTSTKVDVGGVDVSAVNDEFFGKKKQRRKRKRGESDYFNVGVEKQEGNVSLDEKKKVQQDVDKALLAALADNALLKKYLGARFSLTSRSRPHLMSF